MNNKHIFSQFDSDLSALSNHLLTMGQEVEQQFKRALAALEHFDNDLIEQVFVEEQKINAQEIDIDEECGRIIAIRQPAASDLRFVLAVSKAVAILERAADEVVRIVKHARHIVEDKNKSGIPYNDIAPLGSMAIAIFHQSLSAFAELDSEAANALRQQDKAINEEFRKLRAKFIAAMTANPSSIGLSLDMLSIVKAIERFGDYAKKIGEYVVYVSKGTDIRHQKNLLS